VRFHCTTAQSSPGSGLIIVVVDEKYREDTLATVVSGLVLGCLLTLPHHHPFVIV
jgi:hypothetical protein